MRDSQMPTIKINKDILRELGFSLAGHLNIPDTINYKGTTYRITKISKNGFRACRKLVSVSIPEEIDEIEPSAFYRCTKLSNIEFRGTRSNQLHIGDKAICYTRLIEITLPEGTVSLGQYAIADNTQLLRIHLPQSLKTIDEYAFSNCPNVEKIIVPDSVVYLGAHAFNGWEGLTSVKLSGNIHTLAEGTFLDCWNLKEIILPEGLRKVNLRAFDGCANIQHINIPSTIEEIQGDSWLWQNCIQYFSYNGSKDDWENMWETYNYNKIPLSKVIKCLDGNIRH